MNIPTFFSRWGMIGLIAALLAGVGAWLEVSLRMLPQPVAAQPRLLSPQDEHGPTLMIRRVSARDENSAGPR